MSIEPSKAEAASGDRAGIALPEGVPAWITPELIELTRRVWQRHSLQALTIDDAITILLNTGRLLAVLSREDAS